MHLGLTVLLLKYKLVLNHVKQLSSRRHKSSSLGDGRQGSPAHVRKLSSSCVCMFAVLFYTFILACAL
jgi:hypothetical protein